IRHNVRLVKQHVGPDVAVWAAGKANGYGNGAAAVARAALAAGGTWLRVAQLSEAASLREGGLIAPILVLGHTSASHAAHALRLDVQVTLTDLDTARAFSAAAVAENLECRVHIKLDTGMGRLGVLPSEAADFIARVAALPNLRIAGIFSHFSCADTDPDYTQQQIARFVESQEPRAKNQELRIKSQELRAESQALITEHQPRQSSLSTIGYPLSTILHICNSAGLMAYPQAHFDMVRLGIAMYGLSPFAPADAPTAAAQALVAQLRPALSWRTYVASLKTLPDSWGVSYGATYRCVGPRRIAAIPVGYGDGFRRAPNHFGEVLVRGQRAPVVGRVCMDQSMIDVTDIPNVALGDEVVIIGPQGQQRITTDDIAARVGTINYDIVTSLLARSERVYLG
nr:alanine racemase [Anaerolineae bacterium]